MAAGAEPSRNVRAALAAALLIGTGLTGCAAAVQSALLPTPETTDPILRQLARRSAKGDKLAQLELGIRYEEGRGVPVDLAKARQLYGSAASDGRAPLWLYGAAVGAAGPGLVVQRSRGRAVAGLPAARERLRMLQQRLDR